MAHAVRGPCAWAACVGCPGATRAAQQPRKSKSAVLCMHPLRVCTPGVPWPQGAFVVEPGRAVTYAVQFMPGEDAAVCAHELRVRVAQNPYEDYHVALTGEGYMVGGVLIIAPWVPLSKEVVGEGLPPPATACHHCAVSVPHPPARPCALPSAPPPPTLRVRARRRR